MEGKWAVLYLVVVVLLTLTHSTNFGFFRQPIAALAVLRFHGVVD
jgi:hypothetical protein